MRVNFARKGWADYLHWIATDPKILSKVNDLIEDIRRSPFKGLGKPEPLRGDRAGCWSRRISEEHRLVYRVSGAGESQSVEILQCQFHY